MNEDNPTPSVPGAAAKGSKKLWYIIGAVVIIIILSWVLSGGFARNAAEQAIEDATGGDVDYNSDGTATFTNDEGTVTVGSGSYPENWPSDAPKYSDGKIVYSGSSNPQTGEAGSAVVFTTSDSPAEVVAFYKNELKASGWAIDAEATVAGATTLSATKDGRTFGIWAADAGGTTQVTVGIEL